MLKPLELVAASNLVVPPKKLDAQFQLPNPGEPATVNTESLLFDMAGPFAQKAFSRGKALDGDAIRQLAQEVGEEFPFYYQGGGIATISKQIEHYKQIQKQKGTKPSEDLSKELKGGLDCKLSTSVLGYALRNLANLTGQDIFICFVTRGASFHPSLLVETNGTPKQFFRIQYNTEVDSSIKQSLPNIPVEGLLARSALMQIASPETSREYSHSFSQVTELSDDERNKLDGDAFVKHNLNAQGLQEIDNNFLADWNS